jgi:hypothetical protein
MVPGANPSNPGWITVTRKPTPIGSEYHTMACAVTKIIYWVEIVEGKDRPSQLGPNKYSEKGKTVGLLLRAEEGAGFMSSGKALVLDSGFGVLKAIIELHKAGGYAVACFKKKRYWPWGINGEELLAKVSSKPVGTTFTHQGTLQDVPFYNLVYRDSKHVGTFMGPYGSTSNVGTEKTRRDPDTNQLVKFRFPMVLDDYYFARHAVDDNNNWRQGTLNLEESISTQSWLFRQFTFFSGLTESNTYLAYNYFCRSGQEQMAKRDLRAKLSKELIFNHLLQQEEEDKEQERRRLPPRNVEHIRVTLPSL